MGLASFDQVYRAYASVVEANSPRGSTYNDFSHQPYKLLEAYALGWQAERENELQRTSEWNRQQGATTAAVALAMTGDDIFVLVSCLQRAKSMTTKIFKTFQKQSGHIHSHIQPNVIHKKIWWMTGLHQCATGHRPDLVIVDSETAYRKDRDQAVDDLRRFFKCGILVLDAPKPFSLI